MLAIRQEGGPGLRLTTRHLVAGVELPPSALTRLIVFVQYDENKIKPSRFHVPPLAPYTGHKVMGFPPRRSTFFSA
jgi:hypothetical protein